MLMNATLAGMVTLVRLFMLANANPPMFVTWSGMLSALSSRQPSNNDLGILVRLSGRFASTSLTQAAKAKSPIVLTLSGMSSRSSAKQDSNA